MTTTPAVPDQQQRGDRPPPRPEVRWNRVVVGVLIAAAGIGLLLERTGTAVPWNLAPSAAAIVIGVALIASLAGGGGRGMLVVLGVAMLIIATAIGVGASRFAGPAGDVVVTPGPREWPSSTRLSAGEVTVDLTRTQLPTSGRLDVELGAGNVVVRVPSEAAVHVAATVVMGTLTVDGVAVRQGVDIDWADTSTAPVSVVLDVGAGDVEVFHART
ncbi:hypothetical protein [Pseudonocardia sp. GCM10023141]|uniref:hypothetical protein n=1 Tax=Pseudonocardia sp. GCM10023141 TaxID=3252653 RepID=UPI00360DEAD5